MSGAAPNDDKTASASPDGEAEQPSLRDADIASQSKRAHEEYDAWARKYHDVMVQTLMGCLQSSNSDYGDLLEDCLQHLYCTAVPWVYERRSELDSDRIKKILRQSARHALCRELGGLARRRERFRSLDDHLLAKLGDQTEDTSARGVYNALIRRALGKLGKGQREAIQCCCLEGEAKKDFAKRHGISVSAVNTRIRKGREKLAVILKNWGFGQEGLQ